MKTVGDVLKATREQKGWSLEECSTRTKIQERFIAAIESSDLSLLPDTIFVKGFIRTLASELGLNPDSMVALYRRDYEKPASSLVPRIRDHRRLSWQWTPQRTMAAFLGLIAASFGTYLLYQLGVLFQPPTLDVDVPKDRQVVTSPVLVEGRTDPSATIEINGHDVRKNRNGTFSIVVEMAEGERVIRVESVGQNRKTATIERTVMVKKEETR